jgi:hypothetical protein
MTVDVVRVQVLIANANFIIIMDDPGIDLCGYSLRAKESQSRVEEFLHSMSMYRVDFPNDGAIQ